MQRELIENTGFRRGTTEVGSFQEWSCKGSLAGKVENRLENQRVRPASV